MTVCTRCQQAKEHSEFSPDPRKRNGLQSVCRACQYAAKKRAAGETEPIYVGMTVGVKERVRRDDAKRTGEHRCGTVYYVSRWGWATVDFGSYREAFPLSEIKPMAHPLDVLDVMHPHSHDMVREWLREGVEA